MPNQPNDRYQHDPELLWPDSGVAERFPAQPPYRGNRTATLTWGQLNRLPAGTSTRNLNTR
ncbi:hypothetical protein [Micromonospora thermarum]|uniref:DNA repair protein n=1 Tax=Micromonospora thermarum TaxID=2720024 RepID=A0ABX0ZBV2_9ACTN|nr:hypothetical protein [Micromonospora thermarum]NJP33766.1 hypothetical protein [Micromonospora thermarum]